MKSKLAVSDLLAEALAAISHRPGRAALTALGTVLGVGAFVAVLGLTATAGGQISKHFNELMATEITVEDLGGEQPDLLANSFPPDADSRVRSIEGVREAGVYWTVSDGSQLKVSGVELPGRRDEEQTPVIAASPGLLRAVQPTLGQGRLFDDFHSQRAEQVVVLGSVAARRIGITSLHAQPAVFIDGIPFSVIGILEDVARQADMLFAVVVPIQTAESLWGPPNHAGRAKMLIETKVGAAQVVGAQVALALRPDAPDLFKVVTPPDPRNLRDKVSSDLSVLFLLLAAVSLVIGAIGIANTTLVSVLERVSEIGLRRALGAHRRHIASQYLVESSILGTVGGLVGTSLGVSVVVIMALARDWTAVLSPVLVAPAPLIGTLVGVLAGAYPAMQAARIEPAEALRR